jgi:RimJ/RimL family protein N-acetyltransferase
MKHQSTTPAGQVLRTERLELRPLALGDAARIAALAGDWDIARMTARIPYPYSLVDADAWISSIGDGEFVRGIVHQGQLIGACGYVVDESGAAEIGYWIGKDHWGQGFATEAARAIIGHCFGAGGFKRVVCCHYQDNPASKRVIEKLGFRLIGPCVGWCEARQSEAPTLRYEQRRPWIRFLTRRAA